MTPQNELAALSACSKPRRLKVSYKPLKSPGVEVPFLPLRGRWLRDAGFEIGRSVKVEVNEGRLTIEPDDDRARINVDAPYELAYWTKELGVAENTLRAAVAEVGVTATAVRAYLKK